MLVDRVWQRARAPEPWCNGRGAHLVPVPQQCGRAPAQHPSAEGRPAMGERTLARRAGLPGGSSTRHRRHAGDMSALVKVYTNYSLLILT